MKLKSIDYHRNGICGLGFHVLIVQDGQQEMLIVRFDKDADKETGNVVCAAFDLAQLDKRVIDFGENSFRGDHFSDFADGCIQELHDGKIQDAQTASRQQRLAEARTDASAR